MDINLNAEVRVSQGAFTQTAYSFFYNNALRMEAIAEVVEAAKAKCDGLDSASTQAIVRLDVRRHLKETLVDGLEAFDLCEGLYRLAVDQIDFETLVESLVDVSGQADPLHTGPSTISVGSRA